MQSLMYASLGIGFEPDATCTGGIEDAVVAVTAAAVDVTGVAAIVGDAVVVSSAEDLH